MRPIDADALKDFINRQLAMTARTAVVMNAKDFFENIVDNAPTIDAVPVVRCKECRWGKEKAGNIECNADMNVPSEYHGYEWFCPNGERSEE